MIIANKLIVVPVALCAIGLAACGGQTHTTTTKVAAVRPPAPTVTVPHVDPRAKAACAAIEADENRASSSDPVGWFGRIGKDAGKLMPYVQGNQFVTVIKVDGDVIKLLQAVSTGNTSALSTIPIKADSGALGLLCARIDMSSS